jgi:hypothetical protein
MGSIDATADRARYRVKPESAAKQILPMPTPLLRAQQLSRAIHICVTLTLSGLPKALDFEMWGNDPAQVG